MFRFNSRSKEESLESHWKASAFRSRDQHDQLTQLEEGIFEINEKSINSDQSEVDQELQLLQDLKLQEWYQGDLQGYSEKEIKEAIKKELISLSSSGHEVYDPVPLRLLPQEDQAKVIESRWVIGPRSGVLKARFVRKGFPQVIDMEAKYAHTAQATTLKIILMMSQLHKWSLAVSDVASAFSQHSSRCVKRAHCRPSTSRDSAPRPAVWRLMRQPYGLRDSPREWQIHSTQVLQKMNLSQTRPDPYALTGYDSSGNVNLIIMAYVDVLGVSGDQLQYKNSSRRFRSCSASSTLTTSRQSIPWSS